MWDYEHSIEADVSADAVWRLYTDASTWQDWDYGIELMEIDGQFEAGSTGRLTPRGRTAIPFELVHVEERVGFVDETRIGDIVLRFSHKLEELGGGRTKITHRVEITGPGADEVGPQIGSQIADGIPVTLSTLAEIAAARDVANVTAR